MKLHKEPLLHFLALGVMLFGLNSWRAKQAPEEPSASRIEVTAGVIDQLRAGYERQFGRAPHEAELRGLVTGHVREEVLCREALAMGLDRDDTIVRRRLAQKMEFLTNDLAGAVEPQEEAVQRFFTGNAARYAKPGRVTFRHVYFSKEKRGPAGDAAAREALIALEKGASDETVGDSFLHGFQFMRREQEEVSALFGPEFAKELAARQTGRWHGPVVSSYGLHLVRVEDRTAPRPVDLAEVREAVLRDLNEERRSTANREVFEKLRERYQIVVDEAAIVKAAPPLTETAKR
jgi:hypothetical protein